MSEPDFSEMDMSVPGSLERLYRTAHLDRAHLEVFKSVNHQIYPLVLGLYLLKQGFEFFESVESAQKPEYVQSLLCLIEHFWLDNDEDPLAADFIYGAVGKICHLLSGPEFDTQLEERLSRLIHTPELAESNLPANKVKSLLYALSCGLRKTKSLSIRNLKQLEQLYLRDDVGKDIKIYARKLFLEDVIPMFLDGDLSISALPDRRLFNNLILKSDSVYLSSKGDDAGQEYMIYTSEEKRIVDSNNMISYDLIFR